MLFYNFMGESVQAERIIKLLVTFREEPFFLMHMVDFLVIDERSA